MTNFKKLQYQSFLQSTIIKNMQNYSEDDDVMINVVRKSTALSKPSSTKTVTNKFQNKQLKYAKKFKGDRDAQRKARRQHSYNLLPDPADQLNPKVISNSQQKGQQQTNPLHQNQFKQQENSYPSFIEKKERTLSSTNKFKPENRRSYGNEPQVLGSVNTSAKIETPTELKPEKVEEIKNIDKTPLGEMKLNRYLENSLVQNDISKLTDIQQQCFSKIFAGKNVIAKASTGSGKTLAYLIPLINQYLQNKSIEGRETGTVMLIICPSRELCVQGNKQALRCLKRCPFIVPGSLIGGEQTNHQKNRLRRGISVLFSTPGRLIYHLKNTKSFKFEKLKTIVFEEADRTLDMGFQQNINEILEILSTKLQLSYVQKILVSAHFNEKVQHLIKNLNMEDASYIGFSKEKEEQGIFKNEQEINISQNLKQQYILISEEERIPIMIAYLKLVKDSKVMIFVNTIDEVEYLDFLINHLKYRDANGVMTDQKVETRTVFKIHGDLDQKLRSNTYFQFKKSKSAVLIATEVASRGLDFPDLNHIILFDVPPTITDYGNRVGRSARFNSSGVSLLMLHYQQSDYAQKIRYYSPKLELLGREVIYEAFQQYLKGMNIRETSLYYLEGIVRGLIKDDDQKYQLARRAYVSMLRAYAKLKDKHTFAVKKLDLKLLGRGFGINSTGGRERVYNPKAKESHLEALRKKRKVQSVKKMQVDQYL